MKDKGLYPRAHSPLKHMQDHAWLAASASREQDLPLSAQTRSRHPRSGSRLRRLAWTGLAAALLVALVTWGFHSRFGLLLLLLLR